ncbi:hypothetical protein [Kordia sp. SMS9]|nr:hypothetical protein [Kordia sp. SMS9]
MSKKENKDDVERPKEDIKIEDSEPKFKEVLTSIISKKPNKNKN